MASTTAQITNAGPETIGRLCSALKAIRGLERPSTETAATAVAETLSTVTQAQPGLRQGSTFSFGQDTARQGSGWSDGALLSLGPKATTTSFDACSAGRATPTQPPAQPPRSQPETPMIARDAPPLALGGGEAPAAAPTLSGPLAQFLNLQHSGVTEPATADTPPSAPKADGLLAAADSVQPSPQRAVEPPSKAPEAIRVLRDPTLAPAEAAARLAPLLCPAVIADVADCVVAPSQVDVVAALQDTDLRGRMHQAVVHRVLQTLTNEEADHGDVVGSAALLARLGRKELVPPSGIVTTLEALLAGPGTRQSGVCVLGFVLSEFDVSAKRFAEMETAAKAAVEEAASAAGSAAMAATAKRGNKRIQQKKAEEAAAAAAATAAEAEEARQAELRRAVAPSMGMCEALRPLLEAAQEAAKEDPGLQHAVHFIASRLRVEHPAPALQPLCTWAVDEDGEVSVTPQRSVQSLLKDPLAEARTRPMLLTYAPGRDHLVTIDPNADIVATWTSAAAGATPHVAPLNIGARVLTAVDAAAKGTGVVAVASALHHRREATVPSQVLVLDDAKLGAHDGPVRDTIDLAKGTVATCLRCLPQRQNAFCVGVSAQPGGVGTERNYGLVYYNNGSVTRTVSTAHKDYVTCLATSSENENTVISASRDTTVRLWDNRDPKPSATLSAHKDTVTAVAAARDLIITGGLDGQLCLWDVRRLADPVAVQACGAAVLSAAVVGASQVVVATAASLDLYGTHPLHLIDSVLDRCYHSVRCGAAKTVFAAGPVSAGVDVFHAA